tara:strand:- start:4417 stop:5199 length:783 start_codon:yes stop_codon:yes gene_type:complete
MSNWARFCTISCTHCPYQSEQAIDNLLKELKGRELTHFIHLGDVVDAEGASVHADDPASHTLYDEFLVASNMLRRIREALPSDCELILLDGNHDDNIQRPDSRRVPRDFRDLCNPRRMEGVKDEYKHWLHIPYRHGKEGTYRLGNVIFAHGFAAGANSGDLEAITLANDCHGMLANQLIIRGHTHRPLPPTQCKRSSKIKLPLWYANAGYMAFGNGNKRAPYTYRFSVSEWKHACIFGEVKLDRVRRMNQDSWKAELVYL